MNKLKTDAQNTCVGSINNNHFAGIAVKYSIFEIKTMKKFLLLLAFFSSITLFSQTIKADDIIGTYMTAENEGKVEITKRNNKYYGKLVWTKTPGKLDSNNPDPKQKTDKLAGKEILKDFVFDGDDQWSDGTIYDPKNGKTYDCKLTPDEKGNLNVRGFIGISLIGRTSFWIKVK